MSSVAVRSEKKMDRKTISVSTKRQITIPQKFFDALGFDNEAECILQDNAIIVRPIRNDDSGAFSEEILSDLINQGYMGQELLLEFKAARRKVRPAVESLIAQADDFVKSGGDGVTIGKLFGEED